MGVAEGFKGSGVFAKVSLGMLLLAAMFAWIAFTCTGWGRTDTPGALADTYFGLWRICTDAIPFPNCRPTDGWARDWWAATQALVTIGFLGINVSLCLLIVYMFIPSCLKNHEVAMTTAIVAIVTGALYLIGVIVFGANFKEDYIDFLGPLSGERYRLGYAFALSIVALVLEIAGGVMVLLDRKVAQPGTAPAS
ncbi:hypothetical protein MAR_000307 [Mya arenaria]|uniref:Uncharacterized protein n=1 Tax=Mya arenaria TaxID=6604 RepID=A0ABY7FCE2_MYAAR|nr:uncharacterized protein LOC128207761 [Mya arenaria]WAR18469.1 hypothetical protein MAR_000307 [Mya arenaria]